MYQAFSKDGKIMVEGETPEEAFFNLCRAEEKKAKEAKEAEALRTAETLKAVNPASTHEYTVSGLVTISVYTKVTAASKEDALLVAMQQPLQTLCHYCSNAEPKNCWVTNGELDGTAFDLEVEVDE
jgi:hypothetical protein